MSETLQEILQQIRSTSPFGKLRNSLGSNLAITGLSGSLAGLVLGELREHETAGRPHLILAPDQRSAEHLRDDLSVVYGEEHVAYFPKSEIHSSRPHFRTSAEEFRVDAMEKLLRERSPMLVAEYEALSDPIIEKGRFEERRIALVRDQEYGFEDLVQQLIDYGYTRESAVVQPMEISVRGGILDVFPLGSENPCRLEFFGDTLESIRSFSISSQRSLERYDQVVIPPGLSRNSGDGGGSPSFLWDYLPDECLVFWHHYDEICERAEASGEMGHPEPSDRFTHLFSYQILPGSAKNPIRFNSTPQDTMRGDLELFQSQLQNQLQQNYDIYICCENAEQVYRLKQFLESHEKQHVFSQEISQGFTFSNAEIAVYTDHQLYSRYKPRRTFKKFAHEEIPKTVDHLNLGDYLVHQDYGIGLFRGLQKVQQGSSESECIVIEYQDGDKVFVPLQKFNRVQKYQGSEGTSPSIHKLGGNRWERTKKRSREAAEEIAEDLVELYASRHSIQGHDFSGDGEFQAQMESAFLYEETEDQIQSTEEVKEDMESQFPMDRLLIGDVGFGKTEVALRAAFKAVLDSKQVAVLVPTTILAEQHFSTFRDRLQRFPVRIASLSRFRSGKEQREILSRLESGEIDIIIGTHRLLSKDVKFNSLALMIIDEEHRFGVKHKEKLKQMTEKVDVLSMTATPIPRTLQLSLSGARDLSKIETPPKERLPIYTEIASFEDDFIREVIMREVNRGGQVYFVHNRIQNIQIIHKKLKNLLPELSFVVGHGQMPENQLEKVMLDFLHREYDVLISTAIIESGIDIPNVNTIIINRADQMGLAQLYQLRGRVGRANRRAYAYLLVPSTDTMTSDARNRLQTLESFTHLGAGFQIAMKDLAMRGAGNLLGMKQSGFIDSVGFDLYMEMINNAIQEKQIDRGLETLSTRETLDAEINTSFDTYIPEDYISEPDQRIDIYRRLSDARNEAEVQDISDELEDRFGPVPEVTQNLIMVMKIRCLCNDLGIEKLTISSGKSSGTFVADEKMQNLINYDEMVPNMLSYSEGRFIPRFVPGEQMSFELKYRSLQKPLESLINYLMNVRDAVKLENSG